MPGFFKSQLHMRKNYCIIINKNILIMVPKNKKEAFGLG